MPFYFKRGDLVETKCDAIVNASNINLKMVEGVGRAIFHKAGDKELTNACKAIGHCDVGHAVLTPSFNLTSAKAIIHAVGPIYINGKHGEEAALRKTYRSVFKIALENDFKTLAFPLLSGEFNYPLRECYVIAESEIRLFLKDHPDFRIYMVLFKNFPENLSEDEQVKLSKFVMNNFKSTVHSVEEKVTNEEFVKLVKELQAKKNISDLELALNSNLTPEDLKSFLEVKEGTPSKNEVFALAVGLKSSKAELTNLLKSIRTDSLNDDMTGLVTLFYLEKGIYDIYKINRALFNYGVKPLGLL